MVEGRYALIIANNQYNDERLHDLVTPPINAEELKKVLEDTDIAGFKTKPLINETASIILNEIDELFSEKERDDLLLLYFAGHGVRDDKGRLYLAVSKTNCKRLPTTAVESRFIVDRMDDSRSQKKVLILDCCNSGAFDYRMMAVPTSMGTSVAFAGNGTGRCVMTATDEVQFSWEGNQRTGKAEPSVFTKYLIKGLKGEAVDDKGNITFNSLYDYVHDAVVKEQPKQRPQRSLYRGTEDLVIAIGRPKPVRLQPELVDAIGSPFTKTRLDAVHELGRLLRSSNKSLALEAEKNLKFLSDEDDSRMVLKAATEILDTHKKERGYIGEVAEKDSSNNLKVIEGVEQTVKPEAEQEIEAERLEAPQDSEISTINDLNKEARGFFEIGNFEYAIANWEEVLKLERFNREAIDGIKESNRIFESRKVLEYRPDKGELSTLWTRKTNVKIPKNEVRTEQEAQLAELYAQAVNAKKAQDWEQVISACQEILTIDPRYKDTATLLSNAKYEVYSLEEKRKAEEAEKRKNEGIEEIVKPEVEIEDAKKQEALAWEKSREKLINEKGELSDQVNKLNEEAHSFFEMGNFEYAIAKWNEVLKLDEGNKRAKNGITNANNRKKFGYDLWSQALDWMKDVPIDVPIEYRIKSLENEKGELSDQVNTLNEEAHSFFEMGNFEYAIAKWKEVRELDPDNREAIKGIKESNRIFESRKVLEYRPDKGELSTLWTRKTNVEKPYDDSTQQLKVIEGIEQAVKPEAEIEDAKKQEAQLAEVATKTTEATEEHIIGKAGYGSQIHNVPVNTNANSNQTSKVAERLNMDIKFKSYVRKTYVVGQTFGWHKYLIYIFDTPSDVTDKIESVEYRLPVPQSPEIVSRGDSSRPFEYEFDFTPENDFDSSQLLEIIVRLKDATVYEYRHSLGRSEKVYEEYWPLR